MTPKMRLQERHANQGVSRPQVVSIILLIIYIYIYQWWQLKYMFTRKIGEDEPMLSNIFQRG